MDLASFLFQKYFDGQIDMCAVRKRNLKLYQEPANLFRPSDLYEDVECIPHNIRPIIKSCVPMGRSVVCCYCTKTVAIL